MDIFPYDWSTASISGKVATGTLTKLYELTETTELKKGKLWSGVIGGYYKTTSDGGSTYKVTSRKEM